VKNQAVVGKLGSLCHFTANFVECQRAFFYFYGTNIGMGVAPERCFYSAVIDTFIYYLNFFRFSFLSFQLSCCMKSMFIQDSGAV